MKYTYHFSVFTELVDGMLIQEVKELCTTVVTVKHTLVVVFNCLGTDEDGVVDTVFINHGLILDWRIFISTCIWVDLLSFF